MSHLQKHLKLTFVYLLFIQSFLIDLCHVTNLECTCDTDETGNFCPGCLENLSLYSSSAALELTELNNTEEKIISKISDVNIEFCDKCKANSTTMYKMEKKKLCPTCVVEHLSFYFSTKTIEEIKLNCTEIVFDLMNDSIEKKITKVTINQMVNKIFPRELKILEKRKSQNENCDLFLIINEILNQLRKGMKLNRRKCETCVAERFHLIQITCCKKFMCIQCILLELFMKKNPKCVMCQNAYISRNTQDFEEIFKSMAVAIWQKCSLKLTTDRELELQNMVMKIKNSKTSSSKTYKQFADVIKKHFAAGITILTKKEIIDLGKQVGIFQIKHKFSWHFIGSAITVLPQYLICSHVSGECVNWKACVWIVTNKLMTTWYSLACKYSSAESFPNELHAKVNTTIQEIYMFSLMWLNFFFWYFTFGSHFYEHRSFLLLNFVLNKPVLWLSFFLTTLIHYVEIKESFYEFY